MPLTAPFAPATSLRDALADGQVSAETIVQQTLDHIGALDGDLNAFVTLDPEGAIAQARRLDQLHPDARGALHGLPVAVKDLTDTAGLRTTYGSQIFKDHVPQQDDHVVALLRAAGAIIIGKTNTPEFGFGAVCSNAVAGTTRNPYDPERTSGGSSGGSAVAVAAGMVPLAHGTDFGGSVRTPASFCGITALRPTPGAIASPGRALGWDRLSTHGVMGRTSRDCGAMFAILSGAEPRDPTSDVLRMPANGARPRIAYTPDFGVAPLASAVRDRFMTALDNLASVYGKIGAAQIDCRSAGKTFRTLRAAHVHHAYGPLLQAHAAQLMPTARWNIEAGAGITAAEYLEAETARTALYRSFMALFDDIDILVAPAASVMPWPVSEGEVLRIDGRALDDVLDYLAPTYIISLIGFPVLTIPTPIGAGDRLPFGLQLVGRPGKDLDLLAAGDFLEGQGFRFIPPRIRRDPEVN